MFVFYFFRSYNYFFRFFINIFVDKFYDPDGRKRYLLKLFIFVRPGVLDFDGYYSSIFCNFKFYFSNVDIFVLSFIF